MPFSENRGTCERVYEQAADVTQRFVWDIAALDPDDTARFGGKAAGLARMAAVGITVPPAFVISTDAFRAYQASGRVLPASLPREINDAMERLERATGKSFTGPGTPLLVSVRSGAKVSMPGMMDTVLNLGLDASGAARFARLSGDVRFAVDTWMRFWRMFGDIVLGIDPQALEMPMSAARMAIRDVSDERAFDALERAIVEIGRDLGVPVPTDPRTQLDLSICAIFDSWDSARAKAYRKHHGIADDLGTAVTVQSMVFGNLDAQSGSGVAFTRNPNTGEIGLYGEYLTGRQGEDLVSGTHTPVDLSNPDVADPELRRALMTCGRKLEALYADAVDIEFTVEQSRLYLLQVRPAKRAAAAAVRIAVDLAEEGLVSRASAIGSVSAEQVRRLLRPTFDPQLLAAAHQLAEGVGSSPGHASGAAMLDSDRAAQLAAKGERVILLRPTTSPQDIHGMLVADGIVTAKGGALSHAAVVSRALDKPCVVGCAMISVDPEGRTFAVNGRRFPEGSMLSIDGSEGKVYDGVIPLRAPDKDASALGRLLDWADAASGASLWIAAHSRAEARDCAELRPAGLAVVSLTDLLISTRHIDELIAVLARISRGDHGPGLQDELAFIISESSRDLFTELRGTAIDIRLPRVSSERARKLIDSWAELPPRLLLPLGTSSYYRPLVRGITAAAEAAGHGCVTALLAGITDPAEFDRFRDEVRAAGNVRAGAMIQNIAALHAAPAMLHEDVVLWLDLNELIRTSHGFPGELVYAGDVFEEYRSDGFMRTNPRATLKPWLRDPIVALNASAAHGARVAIDCGTAASLDIVQELYRAGCRTFSVSAVQHQRYRLLLGQWAAETGHERQ